MSKTSLLYRCCLVSLITLLGSTAAQAKVELIAIGQLDAHGGDKAVQTVAPLENGAPGNLLGGLGSSLAHVGCDRFLAMPDRGPNATHYNAQVSDTTSYINRFQSVQLQLMPNNVSAPLPYTLQPHLLDTTLLWSPTPLVYGGGNAGLPKGIPALNGDGRYYFTGRSDNFAADSMSANPSNGRLDPESMAVSSDGKRVYVGDEYGPSIYAFDRMSGRRVADYPLPAGWTVREPEAASDEEIRHNRIGRVANHGIEGLAISPDGNALFAILQGALLQDGGTHDRYARIARIDLADGKVTQFVYPLENVGQKGKVRYANVSDMTAVNNRQLLVIERDGKGLGEGSRAAFKRVYRVDLTNAHEIGNRSGETELAPLALPKLPFVDLLEQLTAHNVATEDIPAKIEGLAFGPDITLAGQQRHTLIISSDNDFLATLTDRLHPDGIENPNQFFAFAFDDADLPLPAPAQGSVPRCSDH